jgi:hypothetical protein
MDFTIGGVWWVWWALGTFGIGGCIAIAVLAPAVAAPLAQALFRFFIESRIGNIILAGAICFAIGDINRSLKDRQDFAARTAAFEQAQEARDARIAQETRDAVTKELAEQKITETQIDKEVKDFQNAPPQKECSVDAAPLRVGDDACGLRKLAGQTECESGRVNPRVSKPRKTHSGIGDRNRIQLQNVNG